MFFLWMVSNPDQCSFCGWCPILVTAPELQEDWLGTKDEIGSSNVHLYNSDLHLDLVPQEILVMAPELQEDWIGTKVISMSLSISCCSLGPLLSSSVRDCKRCPSTSLYKLRCV